MVRSTSAPNYHSTAIKRRISEKPRLTSNRDAVEWHLAALWRADVHVLQIAHRGAFALWKAHHHANVILAALNALGLDAIKGVAHLTTQIVQRQA